MPPSKGERRMDYIIIAFRSRSQTMRFGEVLRARGINYEIVNTPRQAYIGCGLSIKTNKKYLSLIKGLVSYVNFSSFAGIFAPVYVGGRLTMKTL